MKTRKMGLASALTVNPGLAAAQLNSSARIVVRVPFEFVVANEIVPAGTYFLPSAARNKIPGSRTTCRLPESRLEVRCGRRTCSPIEEILLASVK
jgi:hypothetical protein